MVTTALAVLLAAVPSGASATTPATAGLAADFAAAAHEFVVPEPILLAVSYNLTNWQAMPTAAGGVGPMGLVSAADTVAGKGGQAPVTARRQAINPAIIRAAETLHTDATTVLTDPAQNIRAAAAMLAADAQATGGVPAAVSAWHPALVRYAKDSAVSGSPAGAEAFADDVFHTLRAGVPVTAASSLSLPADQSIPDSLARRPTTPAPDCPAELDCRFVPAVYDWSSADHSDPNNYGNYDPANRPADGDAIQYIVIHDTEISYDNTIARFQNPAVFGSANYVIRASDGQVTQLVRNQDVAWDVNNWTINQHSISIEHEGVAAQGATTYTPQMYQASAKLVRHLAAEYHIPLDRQHIIAHEDVPGELTGSQVRQHWDPGPFWNWQLYMGLLHSPITPADSSVGGVVTIDPDFATNQPPLTTCASTGVCTSLPAQGANFVYLRTGPDPTAPLIGDPLMHPDGGPGSTEISDWTAKAVTGHQYVVADRQHDWTAIWFDGQKAWFHNPHGVNTLPAAAATVHAPAGVGTVNLYGRAFPLQSDYPAIIPFDPSWAPTPLTGWTLPAGQSYTVIGREQASNYFARFDPAGVVGNHTLVTGDDQYLVIDYNHRYAMVKAADVVLTPAC